MYLNAVYVRHVFTLLLTFSIYDKFNEIRFNIMSTLDFFNILPFSTRLFLPTLITIMLTSSALIVVHTIAETPNILYTILPPITVAFIFCIFVTIKLIKNHDQHS